MLICMLLLRRYVPLHQTSTEQTLTDTQYEALDLKKAALEKFRDAVGAIILDTSSMIRAIKTVYLDIELIDSDTALRAMLINAWLIAGKRHAGNFGNHELIPEFAVDVAARTKYHLTTLVCRCGHDKAFLSSSDFSDLLYMRKYEGPHHNFRSMSADVLIMRKWEFISSEDCTYCTRL